MAPNSDSTFNAKLNDNVNSFVISWRDFLVPYVASVSTTKQLTLISLVWNAIIVMCAFAMYYRPHRAYLILVMMALVLHHVTDTFDGAVGRYNNEGYVRWGYVMDHLFDMLIVMTTFFALFAFLRDKGGDSLLYLFIIMSNVIMLMTVSFLSARALGALDMSVCLDELSDWCIHITHTLYMTIGFVWYVYWTDGELHWLLISGAAIVATIITAISVIRRQRRLSDMDEADHDGSVSPS
jgi:phosphatidylglycerophosphate synthase